MPPEEGDHPPRHQEVVEHLPLSQVEKGVAEVSGTVSSQGTITLPARSGFPVFSTSPLIASRATSVRSALRSSQTTMRAYSYRSNIRSMRILASRAWPTRFIAEMMKPSAQAEAFFQR